MPLPIAVGNTATTFADGEFIVAAGSPASLFITTSADGAIPTGVKFEVAFKSAGAKYIHLYTIDGSNYQELGTIVPPATYAARRLASSTSAGLELKA